MACYTIITEAFGKRFAVSSFLFINILYPFHLLGISSICTADPLPCIIIFIIRISVNRIAIFIIHTSQVTGRFLVIA